MSAFAWKPCFPRTGCVVRLATVTLAPSSRRRITVTSVRMFHFDTEALAQFLASA
jgi:hypothetical protein